MQPKMQRDPGAEALAKFLPYTSRYPLILPQGLVRLTWQKIHALHLPKPKRKDPEINLESRAGRKTKLGAEEEFLVSLF